MLNVDRDARAHAYAAQYQGALADHLPMSLSALQRMGAGGERRRAFEQTYVSAKRLRTLEESDPEFQARRIIYDRIVAQGRKAVLQEELSMLARGIGAGAFHALIRVAYGIIDDRDDEISAGLTYWRDVALDLGTATGPMDAMPFHASSAIERVRATLAHVPNELGSRGLIAARMAIVARAAAFDAAVGHPRFGDAAVAQFAALTVRAFAATRSFTLLHAMTATHALRIVLPYARDREQILQCFWRAAAAAYVSAAAPALLPQDDLAAEAERAPAWPELLALACAADDEHIIKATFTAWTEDATYHDPFYRLAAARYMNLGA